MAFEQLEAALLQLKRERLEKAAAESRRQNADTAAVEQFVLIKAKILVPIFAKAASLLSDGDLIVEIIDQEDSVTHSISLRVDLSTDNDVGPRGSVICRLGENLETCQFGISMTQHTEPAFEKHFKLRELTEEVAARMTERFLVDLIATVTTKHPTVHPPVLKARRHE